MMLGISLAIPGDDQPRHFWSSPAYLAAIAGTGERAGPAAILDFSGARHALTNVPVADIASASITRLSAVSMRRFSQLVNFTRAGTATYIGADGLLHMAGVDEPRFDFTHGRRQLLLEGPATNLLPYSQNFQGSVWSKARATAVADQTGPDGVANSATTITADQSSGPHYILRSGIAFPAGTHVVSIRVRYTGHRWFCVSVYDGATTHIASFDLLNGVAGAETGTTGRTIIAEGNGYFRITMTATTASGTGNMVFGLNQTDFAGLENWTPTGAENVVIYGAQIEQGYFATSYIPTNGSAVTRPADKAQLSEPVAALLRRGEASVLLQGEGITLTTTGINALLSGPTTSDTLMGLLGVTGGIFIGKPNVTTATTTVPLPSFGLASAWDAVSIAGSYQGGSVPSRPDTQEADLPAVFLGRNASGNFAPGWYDQLVIWPFSMMDADLQAKAVPHA